MSTSKQVRAIIFLPGVVTIIIPGVVILVTRSARLGWALGSPLACMPIALGCNLICLGFVLMIMTTTLFAGTGKGTLAPWDPTEKLVTHGIYRRVRNPMISGVFCVLLGEALVLGSIPLLVWFLGFLLGNLIYIPVMEERKLERRFGEEYVRYKREVPRWIPSFRAWGVGNEIDASSGK